MAKLTVIHLDSDLSSTSLHLLLAELGSGSRSRSTLCLGSLSLLLSLLLVILALGQGLSLSSSTNFGLLVSLGGNGVHGSTDDSTLVLDSLSGTLLGYLFRDSLLVHSSVNNGPGNLTRVLALQEE